MQHRFGNAFDLPVVKCRWLVSRQQSGLG